MALYGFRCFGPCKPMHLEIMTHSESVHLCAEFKTGILAVRTDTGGYYYAHVNAIHYPYYN
jgi:hypothetical protein